ncbi:DgyrCDS8219 [Dimorphilus gyrociliatus]|uniref:DgyrCDS8219 n=1 Tax=Dimorphilus gyrociliatus TaxID=2664684 RepID=A0A7I8VV44_9ANNE|nr:DgyrCDS8219 [Dimorphilus gyrociliatus]
MADSGEKVERENESVAEDKEIKNASLSEDFDKDTASNMAEIIDDNQDNLNVDKQVKFDSSESIDRSPNSILSDDLKNSEGIEKTQESLKTSVENLKRTVAMMKEQPDQFESPQQPTKDSPKDHLKRNSSFSSNTTASSLRELEECLKSSDTPLDMHGTLERDGEVMTFVAEGLTDLVRLSSATPSSLSSASGWSGVSRSPTLHSPETLPPVDVKALFEIENSAHKIAASVGKMMDSMAANLHLMSSVTTSCIDAYKEGVDRTCDSVDASIKTMYALMAKCEELSKSMQPVYKLSNEMKEVKRLLELFENQVNKGMAIDS